MSDERGVLLSFVGFQADVHAGRTLLWSFGVHVYLIFDVS